MYGTGLVPFVTRAVVPVVSRAVVARAPAAFVFGWRAVNTAVAAGALVVSGKRLMSVGSGMFDTGDGSLSIASPNKRSNPYSDPKPRGKRLQLTRTKRDTRKPLRIIHKARQYKTADSKFKRSPFSNKDSKKSKWSIRPRR